ncbi:uncharacterized protein LOC143922090 [Arctopsyche grandis]|uniref:uncharacterized protein LOC143922090 n=1 Tax=Arctopsyche grandis TaxID=121162 RepID=UPI00406D6F03
MFADDTVIFAENELEMNKKLKIVEEWMDNNLMEVNTSKCNVVIIGDVGVNPQFFYKNEIIEITDKYVYLGVEINNSLDYDQMAKFRSLKGVAVSESIRSTLGNVKVPLAYKQILLKNLLQPTLLYGSEIFGMNESRMALLGKIMNNSLKVLTRKHNFCRKRVYEELDLKPLGVCAAISRSRCYTKMKDSQGVISELIQSSGRFKARKKTWCTNTKIWLTRNGIPFDQSVKETLKLVHAAIRKRHDKKDKSIIGSSMKKLNLASGRKLREAELDPEVNVTGLNTLFKLRTGTFITINQMVITGRINPFFRNKCIMCNSVAKEDAAHLLVDCNALVIERSKYLLSLIKSINLITTDTQKQRLLKLKILMGGETPAFGRKPADIIPSVTKYLLAMIKKRSALIADNLVINL